VDRAALCWKVSFKLVVNFSARSPLPQKPGDLSTLGLIAGDKTLATPIVKV
jgi:hypothetical protein